MSFLTEQKADLHPQWTPRLVGLVTKHVNSIFVVTPEMMGWMGVPLPMGTITMQKMIQTHHIKPVVYNKKTHLFSMTHRQLYEMGLRLHVYDPVKCEGGLALASFLRYLQEFYFKYLVLESNRLKTNFFELYPDREIPLPSHEEFALTHQYFVNKKFFETFATFLAKDNFFMMEDEMLQVLGVEGTPQDLKDLVLDILKNYEIPYKLKTYQEVGHLLSLSQKESIKETDSVLCIQPRALITVCEVLGNVDSLAMRNNLLDSFDLLTGMLKHQIEVLGKFWVPPEPGKDTKERPNVKAL